MKLVLKVLAGVVLVFLFLVVGFVVGRKTAILPHFANASQSTRGISEVESRKDEARKIFVNSAPYCRAAADEPCQYGMNKLRDIDDYTDADVLAAYFDTGAFLSENDADSEEKWKNNDLSASELYSLGALAALKEDGRVEALDACYHIAKGSNKPPYLVFK